MFYCKKCKEEKDWPSGCGTESFGNCEICGETAVCIDVPSRFLPTPKPSKKSDSPQDCGCKWCSVHTVLRKTLKKDYNTTYEREEMKGGLHGKSIKN